MMISSVSAIFERLAFLGIVGALSGAALFCWQFRQWPGSSKTQKSGGVELAFSAAKEVGEYIFDGSVFRKQTVGAPDRVDASLLSGRFRLAGTFSADKGPQQLRKAIIDDLTAKKQLLVAEGDLLDSGVRVVSIGRDRVVVADATHEEALLLSFAGGTDLIAVKSLSGDTVGESMLPRFGNRVGEHRWVLKREALLEYYQELLDNTERLAKVFESLKPIYQNAQITGYSLDVEGESGMFAGFGLKQGDVIRKLNSMPMISQSRAEYFISEFLQNRVSGFVLDIERNGNPEKLIYLVR